ncbi:roadblock/LC7 domain-containing protein [Demequina oxidasica]|uniref:roadblock/LC7 domain-containing protein n=1 Tax=Demequina oxidasica TaxID=676199 RepID=UPI000782582F|nr:roadblock/LC7 domain-containing protein [Demequina oxidasica]
MIIPKQGLLASARLRRAVPGVHRVLIARTEGLPVYDDVPLAQRDAGAAMTATLVGLANSVAMTLTASSLRSAVVNTESDSLLVVPIDAGHLIAALASQGTDLTLLTREAELVAQQLGGRWRQAAVGA